MVHGHNLEIMKSLFNAHNIRLIIKSLYKYQQQIHCSIVEPIHWMLQSNQRIRVIIMYMWNLELE